MVSICFRGGGWGNSIDYSDENRSRIYGFKSSRPEEGSILIDLISSNGLKEIPVYVMTKMEYCSDPRDMFFADIEEVGEIESDGRRWTPELVESRWLLDKFKKLNETARKQHKEKYGWTHWFHHLPQIPDIFLDPRYYR